MMKILFALLITLTTLELVPSHAASFDCSSPSVTREIDKLICKDSRVSKLDEEMAKLYVDSYKKLSPQSRVTFLNNQRTWLEYWPKKCKSGIIGEQGEFNEDIFLMCARDEYQKRIEQLSIKPINGQNMPVYTVSKVTSTKANPELRDRKAVLEHALSYPQVDVQSLTGEDLKRASHFNAFVIQKVREFSKAAGTNFNEDYEENELKVTLKQNSKDLLELEFNYYFNGFGAHPNYLFGSYAYLISQHRELQSSDVLKGNWQPALANIAFPMLVKSLGDLRLVESPKELMPSAVRTSNWSLRREGLQITFSPYEVAAYAAGSPIVTVPWTQITNYLTDYTKEQIASGFYLPAEEYVTDYPGAPTRLWQAVPLQRTL